MIRQSTRELAPHTWCIDEFGLVNAFVVECADRSAVIDTGCGYGDIRKVVQDLTDKPLEVLLTHGHPDHYGGIYHFKDCRIFMNDGDRPLLNMKMLGWGLGRDFMKMYVETRGPVRCPGKEKEVLATIPAKEPDCSFEYQNVDDGDTIDLGDRVLECIHTPGHSDGSICYLDRSSRILFSGDTVNNSIILMRQPGDDPCLIEKYQRTLEKLWARHEDFDLLAIGHDGDVIDNGIIHDYLTITRGVLDGSIRGAYEEVGFRKGDVARYGKAELWFHCDA